MGKHDCDLQDNEQAQRQALRQKQVAETLGVKQQSYQVYESKTIPSAAVILKLSDAYDVTTDYLLGRSDEPRPMKLDEKTLNLIRAFQDYQSQSVAQ